MIITLYLKAFRKRLWILIVLPLIATMSTALIGFFVFEPIYESKVTMFVINRHSEDQLTVAYEDILIGQQLIKDYRELIKSRSVTRDVLKELGINDLMPGDLANTITVELKNETRILEITVRDKYPKRAQQLADMLGKVFMKKAVSLMRVENVDIIDEAEVNYEPVGPGAVTYTVIILVISLLIALCIIFLLEYLDDTIKSIDDVEKTLGLTVLAAIPDQDIN